MKAQHSIQGRSYEWRVAIVIIVPSASAGEQSVLIGGDEGVDCNGGGTEFINLLRAEL